jgi:hypothetical protein
MCATFQLINDCVLVCARAFYSLHEPHPSHPQSFYDYIARPPPPTAIRSTTLTRNAEIPSSPRHLSPQPSARDYLAPTPRTIQPVPAPGPGHRGEFSPNYESAPYVLPMPVSARTGEMVRELAPPVSSPPLVHDADYPLHSHTHGVPPERLHEACSFEHEHPFDASSHPPHMRSEKSTTIKTASHDHQGRLSSKLSPSCPCSA